MINSSLNQPRQCRRGANEGTRIRGTRIQRTIGRERSSYRELSYDNHLISTHIDVSGLARAVRLAKSSAEVSLTFPRLFELSLSITQAQPCLSKPVFYHPVRIYDAFVRTTEFAAASIFANATFLASRFLFALTTSPPCSRYTALSSCQIWSCPRNGHVAWTRTLHLPPCRRVAQGCAKRMAGPNAPLCYYLKLRDVRHIKQLTR